VTGRSNHVAGLPRTLGRAAAKLAAGFAVCCGLMATVGAATAQAGAYTINANGAQVCALGTFMQNVPGFFTSCDNGDVQIGAPATGSAYNDRQLWEIDSPSAALTITGASFSALQANNINTGQAGYGGGAYWNGGGQPLNTAENQEEFGFGSAPNSATAAFASQYFGLSVHDHPRSLIFRPAGRLQRHGQLQQPRD
jgi:hypothetical protein